MPDIVFIHGLWLSYTAWEPWTMYVAAKGYEAIAPRWPGEGDTAAAARGNPHGQAGFGILQLTEHFAAVIEQFEAPPIAIGHSFGGLIAQKLLGQNKVAAAVAINPAPIKGVRPLPLAQLRSSFPVLANPLNLGRATTLTQRQFRYGFGNALSKSESDSLWEQWSIPSPGRPLFEAAVANISPHSPARADTANTARGPLLITGGTEDHTVPFVSARATFKQYSRSAAITDFHGFDGAGHSLTIDHRWHEVADVALAWLEVRGFGSGSRT